MAIGVQKFEVSAKQHPDASSTSLQWKVFVKVQFTSEDPRQWGELRAFGGGWRRSINRTVVKTGVRTESTSQLLKPLTQLVDIEDCDLVVRKKWLPVWGHLQKPYDVDLRLGNDQHIEIFYRQAVPGVPRSTRRGYAPNKYGNSGLEQYDPSFDENPSDMEILRDTLDGLPMASMIQPVSSPLEIDFRAGWHIIGRDEPEWSGVDALAFVEYWHQAEFQIIEPRSVRLIAKKRLFLRITGKGNNREYLKYNM